jgi:exopolyphosphatase/guanosine-5'-triphosphate,3'-diphosphate pyrophosphatase
MAIGQRAGIPVRILSGDEEARAVYEAVTLGLGRVAASSAAVVFDIGGGSTEVVSGVGKMPGRWASLPFGAVSLTEMFLGSNPPSPSDLAELDEHVARQLMHHCASMPAEAPILAGVGGTITVLAMLDREIVTYDPGLLEGWRIGGDRLSRLVDRIQRSTDRERRLWPAMGEGRADIVVAGCRVTQALVRRFPSSALICSTQGLRYGLARLAASAEGAELSGPHETR